MLEFYKYHGTGNDFIMIDNRSKNFDVGNAEYIKLLCHRHFGIGADGLLLLENNPDYDFEMVYFNSDGRIGSMCGNGGRCIVHFAATVLKVIKDTKHVRFLANDGVHEAEVNGDMVRLKMQNVSEIGIRNGFIFLRSGTTPHNVIFIEDLENYPVDSEGKKIRNTDPDGVNINFVEQKGDVFTVRTYERGVENETMACGTGAVSVAIASHHVGKLKENICHIKMPGGDLTVTFKKNNLSYEDIWLTGPVAYVFKGELR